MPQYMVIAEHTPLTCPSSSASARARAMEGMGQLLPKLAPEAGVSFVMGPVHLDPGHRTVALVEGPTIEAVTQLAYDIGLTQWNTVEVCPVRPIQELMEKVDDFPLLYP